MPERSTGDSVRCTSISLECLNTARGGAAGRRQAPGNAPAIEAAAAASDATTGDDETWMYEPLEVTEGRMTAAEFVMGAICVAALGGVRVYVLIETGLLAGLIIALSIAR